MSRISPLLPAALSDAQRRVFDAVIAGPRAEGPSDFALVNTDGSLGGPFNALAMAGDLGYAVQSVGAALRYNGKLDAEAREIAILVVAEVWDCGFERYAHELVAARLGIEQSILDAIASGAKPPLPPRLGAIYDVARELATTRTISEQTFGAPHCLSEEDFVELLILVGYYTMLAGILNALNVLPPDQDVSKPISAVAQE